MSEHFERVKNYLLDLDLNIVKEEEEEELLIIEDQENGIHNLIIDCEAPILVLEQLIMPVPNEKGDLFTRLLQMNRSLVHGAFALDEDCKYIFYRDTLQLENLDLNELEASIHSLSLALAEYGNEFVEFSKK